MFFFVFALLCTILYSNVGEVQTQSVHEDLGYVTFNAKIGNVADKYQPLNPTDVTASRNAAEAATLIRKLIPTGLGPLPVLDPYRKASVGPIDLSASSVLNIRGTLYLKNLVVFGARNFSLNDVQLRLSNYRSDFDISFPQLYGEADFQATVHFATIPFSFEGHVKVNAYGVTVAGAVRATKTQYRAQQVFNFASVEAQLTAKDLQVSISDSQIIHALETLTGRSTLRSLLDYIKSDIANAIANLALEQGNEIIQQVPAQDILKYLLSN